MSLNTATDCSYLPGVTSGSAVDCGIPNVNGRWITMASSKLTFFNLFNQSRIQSRRISEYGNSDNPAHYWGSPKADSRSFILATYESRA